MGLLKKKQVRYGLLGLVIVGLLLGLKSCQKETINKPLSTKAFIIEVKNKITKEKVAQQTWTELMDEVVFDDLCSEVYAKKFEELGQEFVKNYEQFIEMEVVGDKETKIINYLQYREYFETYQRIGNVLQDFSEAIRDDKYKAAIVSIENLRVLNKQIPIIE